MPLYSSVSGKIDSPSCSCSQFPSAGLANRVLVYLVPLAWPWSILTLKPGLKPKPSPSPAWAFNQGWALSFPEPEPCKAKPKPRLLSPARPYKPLVVTWHLHAGSPRYGFYHFVFYCETKHPGLHWKGQQDVWFHCGPRIRECPRWQTRATWTQW